MRRKRDTFFRSKNSERQFARELISRATPEEILLRDAFAADPRTKGEIRFQVPMQGYFLDFLWQTRRLIIELDGASHRGAAGRRRDAIRTKVLEARGYRVIRYWNSSIRKDVQGTLEMIIDLALSLH